MWLFSPISSFDCLIVCVEIDFRILKHSLSNLLFNSLFSFSFKPFNPYYPSVLPREALWSLDLVKDYINKYWWPIWFLWPCDQPESSFQHITRKFLGGFCPRRWCSDARLQRISSVCETQQHQDFWNVVYNKRRRCVYMTQISRGHVSDTRTRQQTESATVLFKSLHDPEVT